MCGIAGIISPQTALVKLERLQSMADTLAHRGPDGERCWISENGNVGFAHRRLAVIDLSGSAAQPLHYMHYTIIFNGEIYNYLELKDVLQKQQYSFRTASDTEVIAAAFDYWGIECLNYFDGMFAFAIWNEKEQQLFIARDRFGEKPLYYHADYVYRGRFEQFVFASEMKALWAAGVRRELNGTMMLNYITLGYVGNPVKKTETFYSDILSLPQGHYLFIQPQQGKLQMKKWYFPEKAIIQNKFEGNEQQAIEQFKQLLTTSVQRRLRSDVAVGTSLSGGIDSSAIVAIINQVHTGNTSAHGHNLEAFSAVFPGFIKDESVYIETVSNYLNIHSNTIVPGEDDFEKYWQHFIYHQEEPLQSSSVFTQYMVYHLAKEKHVTVLLDGQGADEVLGGYTRYTHWYLQQLMRADVSLFMKERRLLQQNLLLDNWGWKNYAAAYFPDKVAEQLQKKVLSQQNKQSVINKDFLSKYQNNSTLIKPVVKQLEDILFYNTFNFGLQELLRYADRNSMAHSREVRLPFLYHELVEFVFGLPSSFKIKEGFTKWILRKSIEPLLPSDIVWRKGKTGYEPPQEQWMKTGFMQQLIQDAKRKLADAYVLDAGVIKKPVKPTPAHSADNFDWRYLSAAAIL